MPIKISNEVVETIMTEQISQNTKDFNTGTAGAIVPMTEYHKGDFEELLYFQTVGGLRDRNPNANNDAVVDTLNNLTERGVKKYFYKDVEYKITDIKRYGKNPDALAVRIGEDLGRLVTASMLNAGILGAVAAIGAGTNTIYDGSAGKAGVKTVNGMLRKFGDAANIIKALVMHSNSHFNLNDSGIDSGLDTVASGILYNATPATMNRKVYVTDSTSLDAGDSKEWLLGLVPGGVVVKESEERLVHTEIITGKENAVLRVHLEGAFTIGVKGYAYKDTAGAAPSDATLGASANWEQVATSIKNGAGVLGKVAQ